MYVIWTMVFPLSIVICLAFWTLLDPIWDLNPKIELDYHKVFQHFVNMLFFLFEFALSRNAYHLRPALLLYIYALAYFSFTLVHFHLKLGLESWHDCGTYPLRDCPIYPVLDWHHPLK